MSKNIKIGDTTPITLTIQNASVDAGDPTVTIYISTSDTPIVNAATMTEHVDSVSRSKWIYNWDTTSESAGEYLCFIAFEVDAVAQEIEKEHMILSLADFDSISTTADSIETKVDTVDTVVDAIQARTDIIATAAEDITAHGSGAWTSSGQGTGLIQATINVQASSIDVQGVKVTVHNAANDDSPFFGPSTTDISGNTAIFNLDADTTYYVRAAKPAYTFAAQTIAITTSGTYNITGTASVITNPTDPDVCRLYLFVTDISNVNTTGKLYVITYKSYSEVSGIALKHKSKEFTLDTDTTPNSYYVDVTRGAIIDVKARDFGVVLSGFTVPDEATYDLSDTLS